MRSFGKTSTQIPKFGLVLVLRPRCAGVFCSEKSPIVPQLFCSVILIANIRIVEDEDDDEHEEESPISEFRLNRTSK